MTKEAMRNILKDARVGVAGAGGLGSNCAAALARSGVGTLVVADFDTVSEPNLDRQHYTRSQVGQPKALALADTIAAIDPSIQVIPHVVKLDPESIREIFASCQVIVEAFDEASQKSMIAETVLSSMPDSHLVSASGLAGVGAFEDIKVIHRGRLHLCGDFEREVSPENPPCAPRVGIVANLEADLALELLLGLYSGNVDSLHRA